MTNILFHVVAVFLMNIDQQYKVTRDVHGSEIFRTVRVRFEIPAFEQVRTVEQFEQFGQFRQFEQYEQFGQFKLFRQFRPFTPFETTKSLITTN